MSNNWIKHLANKLETSKMSEQVEMEEEDKGTTLANTSNQVGEKKRFEVKKVLFSNLKINQHNRFLFKVLLMF